MLRWRYPDKPIETTPETVAEFNPSDWQASEKKDGWNMPVYVDPTIRCMTRMNKPMAETSRAHFDPSIVEQLASLDLPSNTILGTEFMGPRGHHEPGVFIFDCMAWDGEWLTMTPYEDRWQHCLSLAPRLAKTPRIHLVETVEDDFLGYYRRLEKEWLESNKNELSANEGIVLKRRSGTLLLDLRSSKKNSSQFKIKFREIKDRRW